MSQMYPQHGSAQRIVIVLKTSNPMQTREIISHDRRNSNRSQLGYQILPEGIKVKWINKYHERFEFYAHSNIHKFYVTKLMPYFIKRALARLEGEEK